MNSFTFPREQHEARARARSYAWRSITLIMLAGIIVYLVTGRSQTMKTAWVTDVLSTIPSVAFLIATRYELRPPNERYPYGHFRALSICFLLTATVLLGMGAWLLLEALLKLIHAERPGIGAIVLFGRPIWLGWAMMSALAFSMFVGMYCGRIKQPIARTLHSKAIEAESATNRNEWMSEGAGIAGILLVGFGLWWADAAAASLISLQIIHEGWHNLRQVLGDLMDEAPSQIAKHELEPLPRRVQEAAEQLPWVEAARVRLREHGHVITGDILVVPRANVDLVGAIADGLNRLQSLDWRLHDLTMMPVQRLPDL
jgi:cation diffusion facilitator family transporter